MPTRKDDEKHDRAVEDSFPASDPPANSGIVGPQATRPASRRAPREQDDDSDPKATPTNERHAAETAHQEEREEQPPK
jgi:hypothetical protein